MALGSPEALAIDWTKTWANPPSHRLPPCEETGSIYDGYTRPQLLSRYSGLSGNVERIADMLRGAGWKSQGRDASEVVYIKLDYRFVCTARLHGRRRRQAAGVHRDGRRVRHARLRGAGGARAPGQIPRRSLGGACPLPSRVTSSCHIEPASLRNTSVASGLATYQ
jgi:hypothetical protein